MYVLHYVARLIRPTPENCAFCNRDRKLHVYGGSRIACFRRQPPQSPISPSRQQRHPGRWSHFVFRVDSRETSVTRGWKRIKTGNQTEGAA